MKKTVNINLNIALKLVIDSQSDVVEVLETSATVLKAFSTTEETANVSSHIISESENKYGILTLGAKSRAGMLIPTSSEITIIVNGEEYKPAKPVSSHKHTRGRIDGLTRLYREYPDIFKAGSEIRMQFQPDDLMLFIQK
ncbi:hypothetical protein ACY2EZ_002777 [Listeria innocua]|uniref:hypothetical protein n=1 Tax=Listeria innocua TaxID=1642 RepID=UPI0011CBD62F|nr:hypothetical protein [Listeria innocua]MBM5615079.1 hypothetical protein [Listeria innocua]MBM5683963.1 hypothetical protein [Listeria innocua]TXJ80150.1 hypothetical protein FP564_12825 [Listeria innocua]HBN5116524.1 hypothetical protein [Listeria innocua]HBN5117068.1 hypothetical protein [Listeria innocua]